MQLKRFAVIIIIFAFVLCFSSCWDSLDINNKDLTTAVAVDKLGDEYEFVVEIANITPKKNGEDSEGGEENFSTFSTKGNSYVQARRILDFQLDKPIFLGTVRMLLLADNVATDDVGEYLYRLRNLFEYRKAVGVVTTSEEPSDIFEIQAGATSSAGHNIEEIIRKLHKTGKSVETSASSALEELSRNHICFLIPDISIVDEVISLSGYSVVQKNSVIEVIPIEETKGINMMLNGDVNYVYVVPFGDNQAAVDVKLEKRKIKANYAEDKIDFQVDFEFTALVKYLSINDGFDRERQQEVVNNLRQLIEDDITSAIDYSQKELKADYLDFDEVFRMAYQNEYKKMDWYERYPQAKVRVGTKVTLDPGGDYEYNPDTKWKEE